MGGVRGRRRHPAAAGRLVVAPGLAEPLLERLVTGAERLRLGDPEDAATEVGPLASRADLEAVERLVAEAESGGAERLCGGPVTPAGPGRARSTHLWSCAACARTRA